MGIAYNQTVPDMSRVVFYYDADSSKGGVNLDIVRNKPNVYTGGEFIKQFENDPQIFATTAASSTTYNSSAPSPGTGFSGVFIIRRTAGTSGTWDPICLIDNGGPRYRQLWFGWYFNTTDRIHNSIPYYVDANNTTNWWSTDPTWANAGLTLQINQWYMYAFSYNNSTRECRTFINGNLATSGTRPGLGDANNPNNARITLYGTNNNSYQNSQIKFAVFYNKPLSDNEVSFWYNNYGSNRFNI